SANAKAGAGTVNITFVAGPVDAAQSEVTVPVGAAVQGDPLELHLYARDANRNPVSAAQLDKVNVAIAATGTGVTLTATKTGDDTDATGPYRKYSLVPDTASYATQAIRYNTVTVQVNGTKIGTEYHAAWSPDIDLSKSNEPVYTNAEVRQIIQSCSRDLVVVAADPASWKVWTATTRSVGTSTEACGPDPQTQVRPLVRASANMLPEVGVKLESGSMSDWTTMGSSVTQNDSTGWKERSGEMQKTFSGSITGGAALPTSNVYIGRTAAVRFDSPYGSRVYDDHVTVRSAVGFLTSDDRGNSDETDSNITTKYDLPYAGGHVTAYATGLKLAVSFKVYKTKTSFWNWSAHDMSYDMAFYAASQVYTERLGTIADFLGSSFDQDATFFTVAAGKTVYAFAGGNHGASKLLYTFSGGTISNNNNVSNPHWLKARF
ncbi:hypothetical protein LY007_004577, partial [Salmonella enterica]|nr:hypothetical protein [Salmonella enterica]